MKSWHKISFGELVDFPPKVSLRNGDSFPFIGMEDLDTNSRYVQNFSIRPYSSSGSSKFQVGDVLMARITPCLENGKIAQVQRLDGEAGFGSTEFFVYRAVKDKLTPGFLFYLAKSDLLWKSAVNSMVGASGRQRADAKFLKKVIVTIPNVATQEKIAAILTAYDDLIEVNKRRIALLEKMAEELYREWFVRMRFPGHQNTKFVKGVPVGWKLNRFTDLVVMNPRESVHKGDSVPYVGMENLSQTSMHFVSNETRIGASGSKFRNRDSLLPRITPCLENGKRGFVSCLENGQVGVGSTEFIVFREKILPAEYIYLLTCNPSFRQHAELSMTGASGRQRVQHDCFDYVFISTPPESIRNHFLGITQPMFESISLLADQVSVLTRTRDLLLPRLISGKIAVEDLDIQFPPSMREEAAEPSASPRN